MLYFYLFNMHLVQKQLECKIAELFAKSIVREITPAELRVRMIHALLSPSFI